MKVCLRQCLARADVLIGWTGQGQVWLDGGER